MTQQTAHTAECIRRWAQHEVAETYANDPCRKCKGTGQDRDYDEFCSRCTWAGMCPTCGDSFDNGKCEACGFDIDKPGEEFKDPQVVCAGCDEEYSYETPCTALVKISYCMGCQRPTTGAIGASGLFWFKLCQPCKSSADHAATRRTLYASRILKDLLTPAPTVQPLAVAA